MTGIRKSMVYAREAEYGKGIGPGEYWMPAPPGTFTSHSHNRSTNRIDAMGSRKYDTIAYGAESGSFNWSFYLDYEYLDPLRLMFHTCDKTEITKDKKDERGNTVYEDKTYPNGEIVYELASDEDIQNGDYEEGPKRDENGEIVYAVDSGGNTTTDPVNVKYKTVTKNGAKSKVPVQVPAQEELSQFEMKITNTGRVPSFVIRIITMNVMAGGEYDEILEVRGCVMNELKFTQSAGSSQWGVTTSGFCAREVQWLGKLEHTDYEDKETTNLVEFACLFNGDDMSLAPSKNTYIANCNGMSFTFKNNTDIFPVTCSPFCPTYIEGKTEYGFAASVYSTDPKLFKQRLFTGGRVPTSKDATWSDDAGGYLTSPLCKGLSPKKGFKVVSYDLCCCNASKDNITDDKLKEVIEMSTRRIEFDLTGAVIKAMSWQRGEAEKLVDSISSVECKEIVLKITLPGDRELQEKHMASIVGYRYDNDTCQWITVAEKEGDKGATGNQSKTGYSGGIAEKDSASS